MLRGALAEETGAEPVEEATEPEDEGEPSEETVEIEVLEDARQRRLRGMLGLPEGLPRLREWVCVRTCGRD